MKKQIFSILLVILTLTQFLFAEEPDEYPKTKPIVKIYSNYHFGLNDVSNGNGFELTRAYLGYDIKLSDNISFKTNIDVGNPKNESAYELTAYLKTAALEYKKDNLKVNFGLIGLKQFKLQETIWGHRYIYKSFQDQHKFGHSADLGLILEYKIIDNLSVDGTIRNGEGYKELQGDNTYRGALGFTLNFADNFLIRGSYDITSKDITQTTYSGFFGYENKELLLAGVEYNYQTNHDYVEDENLTGFSIYASIILSDKYEVFGRFDNLGSNKLTGEDDPWNIGKNGSAVIGGLQYKLHQKVKMAANLQYWSPVDDVLDNQIYMYINFEYSF